MGPVRRSLRRRVGKERLIQITGNDALTGFTAPKILWVAENEPEVYARARHILLPKDYLRYKLPDGTVMDPGEYLLLDERQFIFGLNKLRRKIEHVIRAGCKLTYKSDGFRAN